MGTVVKDEGGPKENLIPEETGFVIAANDESCFVRTLLNPIDDPERLNIMNANARLYSKRRSFEKAYMDLWNSYRFLN